MRTAFRGVLVAGMLSAGASALHSQTGSISVNTQWSLYLAGGNTYSNPPIGGQPGIAPTAIALAAGVGRQLTVSSTGSASFCPGGACVAPTPDGPAIGGTGINASGSISGINASSSGFLAAVFLGASLPASAPASATFNNLDFASFSPLLGQVFFVGNGFTSASLQQIFDVPTGADFLYFGIADGNGFFGDPGFYDDNVGSYETDYTVVGRSVVPEPSTYAMLVTGLALIGFARRRRSR